MESPRSVAGVRLSPDVRLLADRRRLQFAEDCLRIGGPQWRFMPQGGRNVFGQLEGPCLVEVKAVVEVVCLYIAVAQVFVAVRYAEFFDNSVRLLDFVVYRRQVAGVVCQISSFDNCRDVYCCLCVSVSDALRMLDNVRSDIHRRAMLNVVGTVVNAVSPDVDHNVFDRGHSRGLQCSWHRAAGALYGDASVIAKFAQAIGA